MPQPHERYSTDPNHETQAGSGFSFRNLLRAFTPQDGKSVGDEGELLLNPTEEEKALLTDEVDPRRERRLSGGSNQVMHVTFRDGRSAIYKPGRGEQCLSEFPEACYNLYKRERAAYLVDRAMGFGLVPPTVLRTLRSGEGSVQKYIPDAENLVYAAKTQGQLPGRLYAMGLLDYAIWNKDRSDYNMLKAEGRLFAIDNGLSFDEWPQYYMTRNLESYVYGQRAPAEVIDTVGRFMADQPLQTALREKLTELVPERAVEAVFARTTLIGDSLARNGRIDSRDNYRFVYKPR